MGDLSPFRTGFLKVALFYNGVWNDIAMSELGDNGVTIKRGRSSETTATEPSSCSFRLKDPTGKYQPRNPNSPLYGLIGRGTPVRVQVELVAGVVWDRWYGKVVTFEPHWSKTGSKDAYVSVECAGTLRRLAQGASPLRSAIYRGRSTLANLQGYWPMEDASDAKTLAYYTGVNPMTFSGAPTLASYSGFLGSSPLPVAGATSFTAVVPTYTPSSCQVRWLSKVPAATPTNSVLCRVLFSGGTLARADLIYTTGGNLTLTGFDSQGTSLGTALYGLGVDGKNMQYSLDFATSGANVAANIAVLEVGALGGSFGSVTFTGATIGRVKTVILNPNKAALTDVPFGHLTVESAITSIFDLDDQLNGYQGEQAHVRIARLCTENGISYLLNGTPTSTPMGPQKAKTLLELLRECEAADGGFLVEPRSTTDLSYRTRETQYNTSPITIAYTDNLLNPFEPSEDDQATRNVVTVTRDGGSSATVSQASGALGTTAVGIYDEAVTLSLQDDTQPAQHASWRVHLGTVDEARWPVIGLDMANPSISGNATLRDNIIGGIGLGTRVDITNIPSWLPPFPVSQVVQGYTEVITPLHYKITYNCTPASPYRAAYWNAATDRWSGDGTVLAGALTTATTSFTVTPPANVTWTHVDGDYDILIDGERMTVTAVTGNTFTVTRSVNGVVKAHSAGAAITLADPVYYGL